MTIIVLRTLTGEDILGKEVFRDNNAITLETPVRMIFVPDRKSMALVPVCLFADDSQEKFEFNRSLILTTYTPQTDIINQYNTQFGTGLFVPPKQGLILP